MPDSEARRLRDATLVEMSFGCRLHDRPVCTVVRDNETGDLIHISGDWPYLSSGNAQSEGESE